MIKNTLLLVSLFYAIGTNAQLIETQYNTFNSQVRNQQIPKAKAKQIFAGYMTTMLRRSYSDSDRKDVRWCFPLRGYDVRAIGGKNGSGYLANGYDFFDGNKHGGHPAHDIFIQDRNQDCLDDNTKKNVEVLAPADGVVIAVETDWHPDSEQRGGNYIWMLCAKDSLLLYFAHNKTVLVSVGTVVKRGDVIATVGRSGANATKKRSPTHLHFSVLKVGSDLYPMPINPYNILVKSSK